MFAHLPPIRSTSRMRSCGTGTSAQVVPPMPARCRRRCASRVTDAAPTKPVLSVNMTHTLHTVSFSARSARLLRRTAAEDEPDAHAAAIAAQETARAAGARHLLTNENNDFMKGNNPVGLQWDKGARTGPPRVYLVRTISTLRLSALPAAVLLSAMGLADPYPTARTRPGSMP